MEFNSAFKGLKILVFKYLGFLYSTSIGLTWHHFRILCRASDTDHLCYAFIS